MQAFELALGYEHKFDWNMLVAAAVTAEVNAGINKVPGFQSPGIDNPFNPTINPRNTLLSTFADDVISSEIESGHFSWKALGENIENAAAQALGTTAGIELAQQAKKAYNDIEHKPEQKLLKKWQQDQTKEQIEKLNARERQLESFGEEEHQELEALGTTNLFTGEPLDSNDSMDATQQAENKNPSYNQRQNTKEQSQSKAAQWNAQQKTKTSFGAAVASSIGNFLDDVGDYTIGELRGIKDITNLDFSDRNKLSNSWGKVGYALGIVGGFVGSIASGEEEAAVGAEAVSKLNRFDQAAKALSEEGQQNIRILRNWAKSKGWERLPNPHGGPEIWGTTNEEGNFVWTLKIKPEAGISENLKDGSLVPRFDARYYLGKSENGQNAFDYVNPFSGEIGDYRIGTHINLETLHPMLQIKVEKTIEEEIYEEELVNTNLGR